MLNYEEIKEYWDKRANIDSSAQSTTQDFYLREIEFSILSERIEKFSPSSVADVGCGDGRTTSRLAAKFPRIRFFGFDYSSSMIGNALHLLKQYPVPNITFQQFDILDSLSGCFDLIYSTRCLINIPSWELQKIAIDNIHISISKGGVYLMVENFIEGHNNFNKIRSDFGLSEIPIREHNLFFSRELLIDHLNKNFKVVEEINISSTYYLMSRIVYSKICSELGSLPDYFNEHHRIAAGLPFCGEYGPIRLLCLQKYQDLI